MKDQAAAARWLAGQSDDVQEKYRPLLVIFWAREDPDGLKAFLEEIWGKRIKRGSRLGLWSEHSLWERPRGVCEVMNLG
jgi:hypothetical protein